MDTNKRKIIKAALIGVVVIAALAFGAPSAVMAGFLMTIVSLVLLLGYLMDKNGAKEAAAVKNQQEDILEKKYFSADIHKYGTLIFLLGLTVSLGMVLTAFEWKSYDEIKLVKLTGESDDLFEEVVDIPHTIHTPPPPPQVLQQPELLEVPDDEEIKKDFEVELDVELKDEVSAPITVADFSNTGPAGPPSDEKVDEVFEIVEESAEPDGGMQAFYKYVGKNMEYPNQAKRMGVEGKVFVQFIIDKDGKITDVKAVRGIGAGCDEEAVRVLQNAPKWKPGKQRGRAVRQRMVIPISFKLN